MHQGQYSFKKSTVLSKIYSNSPLTLSKEHNRTAVLSLSTISSLCNICRTWIQVHPSIHWPQLWLNPVITTVVLCGRPFCFSVFYSAVLLKCFPSSCQVIVSLLTFIFSLSFAWCQDILVYLCRARPSVNWLTQQQLWWNQQVEINQPSYK